MQQREHRVVLETGRLRITGSLLLPSDGFRSRLTDYLNAPDREFVPLTDATIAPLDGVGRSVEEPFVAVARGSIVLAIPVERDEPG